MSYDEMHIENGSVVYCDPPYAGTTGYADKFDSERFFEWCREQAKNSDVYVSEYAAPDDFECIAQFNLKSSLSANGVAGGSKESIEKLFKVKS